MPVKLPTSLFDRLPRLAPLALALAVAGTAFAQTIEVTGAPGQGGSNGAQPGAPGGTGAAGGAATAIAGSAHSGAIATGGHGGRGGDGAAGAPGQPGGAAGNGGAGGAASAQHTVGSVASAIDARAQATGGNGGAAGVPGAAGTGGSAGAPGAGGNGGDATAAVTAVGTGDIVGNARADGGAAADVRAPGQARHAGAATATATLLGGRDAFVRGFVRARGGNAGNTAGGAGPVAGGAARGTVNATGFALELYSTVVGGNGSAAGDTGAGGRGGDADSSVRGTVGAGYLSGELVLRGGFGGNSTGGTGGAGGDARLDTRIAAATTGAIDLWVNVGGGDAGAGGAGGGRAGDGVVDLDVATGRATIVGGQVRSFGGRGGDGAGPAGTAMQGGQGRLAAHVTTQGRLALHVNATGGDGGAGIDGHGGQGGDAIATATGRGHATRPVLPGSELYVEATGGAGGAASAAGKRAGDGGTGRVAGTVHGTGSAGAQVRATVTGGRGGTATGQALAGNGGAAHVNNVVDGGVEGQDGAELYLEQKAVGGEGGYHGDGTGGRGGAAVSTLTRAVEEHHATTLRAAARGGNGGIGVTAGDGGAATATLDVTRSAATGRVFGIAEAVGGGPGYGQGGLGGHASARSVVRSVDSATALATADGRGWTVDRRTGTRGRADAFARAESAADASASASATAARLEGGVAHVRSEAVSNGPSFATAALTGGEGTATSFSQTTGTSLSAANAGGDAIRGGLQANSVAQHGTGRVETEARMTFGGASRWTGADVGTRAQVGSSELILSADTVSFGYLRPDLAILYPNDPAVVGRYAGADVIGVGRIVGGGDVGATLPTRYATSARFVFDVASAGTLRLDLLNFRYREAFSTLEFSVAVQGAEVWRHTFHQLGDAQAFFSGSTLELGLVDAGPYDVLISADFLYGNPGWVGFDYVLAAVPEPATWLLLAAGLLLVLVRLRGRARG